MPVFHSFFAFLFLIAALIAVIAGTLFFIRFQTKLTGWAGVFSLAMAFDLALYYLVLTSVTPASMEFWFRALVITYLFLSITWLFFVLLFTGHIQWINVRTIIAIGVIPIFLAGLLLLSLTKMDAVWMNTIGSVTGWTRSHGLFGYLFALYIFGIDFISLSLLIHMVSSNHPYFRNLALFLCLGTLIVIVAGFLELGGTNPFAPISIVQLFKIVHSVMAFVGVFIFRGGQVLPVARDAAFRHIQDILLVLDQNDNLVDLNPAALQILDQAEEIVIGKPISQVWKPAADLLAGQSDVGTIMGEHTLPINGLEQTFDIVVSPVLDANREGIGRVIVLRNITRRERMEKALQERTQELMRTNKLITALSRVTARLGSAPDTERGFNLLGVEMRNLNMHCAVVSIDPNGDAATVIYVSLKPGIIQRIEKMSGFSLKNYLISKNYWPNVRILKEKSPIWYSSPRNVIRRMFPALPESIANQVWGLVGIEPAGKMCILPLLVDDKLIGAMPIWGVDLQPVDDPILSIFASQVAGILQNAIAHESETRRADELARSNSMILALSKVAAHLESSSPTVEIFETVGGELKSIGIDSMVGLFDEDKSNLQVQYVSIKRDVIHWAEKITSHTLDELLIPRHLWPTDKVITEKTVYWDPNLMKGMLSVFSILPEDLHKVALKMAGINPDDPVCYLPLANEYDVIGVLAVWGTGLKQNDVPALNVLASQLTTAIRNAQLYETEAQRAQELDILLKASEATSSSLDFNTVMHTLASQLLEISGFESCFISEWDRTTNAVFGRIDHSRIFWREGKREAYSMKEYPRSLQVLQTGIPIILQGDFVAEEKKWMEELSRTGVIILALYSRKKVIGLVEIANITGDKLFTPQALEDCRKILSDAALWLLDPLPANEPKKLFELEEALLQATGASVCSFSEWDRPHNNVLTIAVFSNSSWEEGQGPRFNPNLEIWKDALYQGKTSIFENSRGGIKISSVVDNHRPMDAESLIVFPLQKGDERIGVIELYDFNHKMEVTPEQITLLRTIADKASFSIENARLFEQTRRLSITDPMTELYNRRHFFEIATVEFERTRRYNRSLSTMMIDIDHFKNINDTHGHAVGDLALREIVDRIKSSVRAVDIVARFGGEEFIVLMPETGLDEASQVAERIRRIVADSPIVCKDTVVFATLSLGVAEIAINTKTFDELIKYADRALYKAKAQGRNRVESYKVDD